MAEQKIYFQQIANTGGLPGQVLVANSTGVTWGDANNTAYVGTVSAANVVSNAQLSANLANYQTTAGLSGNVATLTANNASYLGTIAAASYVQNTDSRTLSGNIYFTAANVYFGTALYVGDNVDITTTSVLVGNATVNTNISAGSITLNGTSVLTSVGTNYLTNTGNFTVSGNLNFTGANSYFSGKTTHAANLVLAAGISVIDSTGSQGTSNQVLTSNGSGNVYWATVSGSGGGWTGGTMANAATFSNTVTFSNVVTMTSNLAVNGAIFLSNGTGSNSGTAGQVLTSAGSGNAYWSTISGGGGGSFTNGASIAVSNLAYTNTTGTSTGIAYSFINTTSNSLDTVFA